MEILKPSIEIILTALATGVAVIIITYIEKVKKKVDTQELQGWAKYAVQTAEMLYREAGTGEQKKQFVMEFLRVKFEKIDMIDIDVVVESVVYELKQNQYI